MDNPWANAWRDTDATSPPVSTSWNPKNVETNKSDDQHDEADLAMPSWQTGAAINWDEPSDAHTSLWNSGTSALTAKGWESSPYDDIQLGKSPSKDLMTLAESERASTPPRSPVSSRETSPSKPSHDVDLPSPDSPLPTDATAEPPPPDSPNAFGSFETGLGIGGTEVDPWSQPRSSRAQDSVQSDEWDTYGTTSQGDHSAAALDEWEAARRRKQRQDSHAPPELLASIRQQFNELAANLWSEEERNAELPARDSEFSNTASETFDDLSAVVNNLAPQDQSIPPSVPFSRTVVARKLSEALKLTRHASVIQKSPMAIYLSSKGSSTWETSVKDRKDTARDEVPLGWKIAEEEQSSTVPTDEKKKSTGGIFSLFGRKTASTPQPETGSRRSMSPVPSTGTDNASVRSSAESSKPSSRFSLAVETVSASTDLSNPTTSASPTIQSPQSVASEPPPTSVVSRFLSKFSRNRSSGQTPRQSLALSSDDIEFLSDIVPVTNNEPEMDLLAISPPRISTPPLPMKLPPPPKPSPAPKIPQPIQPLKIVSQPPTRPQSAINDSLPLFNAPRVSNGIKQAIVSAPGKFQASPAQLSTLSPIEPLSPSSSRTEPVTNAPSTTPSTRTGEPAFKPSLFLHQQNPTSTNASDSTGHSFAISPPPPSKQAPLLPPPPPSHRQSPMLPPVTSGKQNPILPPSPPRSNGSNPAPSLNLSKTPDSLLEPFDEDFSDFHSSPPSQADVSVSSISSNGGFFSASSSQTQSSLDDFDDFVSSPLRTPSPPRPLPKSLSYQRQASSRNSVVNDRATLPAQVNSSGPPRRASRAADHQRTLSLLQTAASRTGTWPAPRSPLPDALPPPKPSQSLIDFDPFGDTSANTHGKSTTLAQSVSSPAALPRPNVPLQQPNLFSTSSTQSSAAIKQSDLFASNSSAASTTSGTKGLSAQDLSFFEGL